MSPDFYGGTQTSITQAQYAYTELRRAIISGKLPGSSHIVQSEWAEKLQVSITPIREAIRRLEQDGLVQAQAHKGTSVTALSVERVEEIYALRLHLDPLQLRAAKYRSPRTAVKARQICLDLAHLTDPVRFADMDLAFHQLLFGLTDTWTSRLVHTLLVAAAPYVSIAALRAPQLLARANQQHWQQLEAWNSNDTEMMVNLHLQHLRDTRQVLREVDFATYLGS